MRKFLYGAFFVVVYSVSAAEPDSKILEETWDAAYLKDARVGYVHSVTQRIVKNGQPMIHSKVTKDLRVKSFDDILEMKMEENTFESLQGEILSLEYRSMQSRQESSLRAVREGKSMKFTIKTTGKEVVQTLPWDDDILGPHALNEAFRKTDRTPGQKTVFKTFISDLNKVGKLSYIFKDLEETDFPDGKKTLQKASLQMDCLPNVSLTEWMDSKGMTMKSVADIPGGLITYRTTKEAALKPLGELKADLGISTLVKVERVLPFAGMLLEVTYRIHIEGENPERVLPVNEGQRIVKKDGVSCLLVKRIEPDSSTSKASPPGEFLKSNNFIQSDNPKIMQTAVKVVGAETDPWKKAQLLEKWVARSMSPDNTSVAFASAGEVIDTLQGDCTEHGVLLSAMARSLGIPSRVAIGLVFTREYKAFAPHMWSEVWIRGKWYPLDATQGLGFAGGDHIKLGDSGLDGIDAQGSLVPAQTVTGKMKIEVLDWKVSGDEKK